ncbi:MAG: hypothetical protein VKO39_14040 [Cyanobacteriota bacterium]|nr:hypothetical protein [Cyanobacteriota bacterium]
MADPQRQPSAPPGAVLLSAAVFGALAGAGGLAWWLWRQSRRRTSTSGDRPLSIPSPFPGPTAKASLAESAAQMDGLPDRVQQLNQAIEDVRRQLESLQSQP